jgi:hypothetical protein
MMHRSLTNRKGYAREHRTPPAPEVVTVVAAAVPLTPEAEALARDNAAIAAAKKADEQKRLQERTRLCKKLDEDNKASMDRAAARMTTPPMTEKLYRERMKEMDERDKVERRR